MLKSIAFLFCLIVQFHTYPLQAQHDKVPSHRREQFTWFRYYLEIPVSDKWQFEQEIEERLHINPSRQGEFRLRSHLVRDLGKGWSLDLGNMFVWESKPIEPRREELEPRMEIRPHQRISYTHSLGDKWNFEHTYKIEERFFRNKNEEGLYRNAGMSLGQIRFRYELEIEYQLNDWLGLIAFEEVVFYTGPDIGPNPFDRNEMGGGLSLKFSEHFKLDTTYSYRYNPEGIGFVIVHQHIGRLTLIHKLNPKRD